MKKPLYKETELLLKYWNNQLSETERREFEQWLNQFENGKLLLDKLKNDEILKIDLPLDEDDQAKLWEKIKVAEPSLATETQQIKVQRIWPRFSVAAAVIMLMVGAYYITQTNKQKPLPNTEQLTIVTDKEPGRDGAILKLADGREIVLDNAGNGNLAQQGGTDISKQGNMLAYNQVEKSNNEVLYNTLRTPVGRQFKILLPDGTKAWLNSYSSITYPTVFTGKERSVTVNGEVYMEVAKNISRPFKVHVTSPVRGIEETIVEVLGTHFNINAYGDENSVKTTLLEGKVKVMEGSSLAVLKPGQQAQVEVNKISVKTGANSEKETAWKNGLFNFNNEKLKVIMPQISRWYDVDVVYENKEVQDIVITGEIERNANLSEVLKILTYLKIEYKLDGRKLILKG